MNPAEAEGEVDRIMKIVDKNESGEIDYSGNVIPTPTPYNRITIKEWVMATIDKKNLLS